MCFNRKELGNSLIPLWIFMDFNGKIWDAVHGGFSLTQRETTGLKAGP